MVRSQPVLGHVYHPPRVARCDDQASSTVFKSRDGWGGAEMGHDMHACMQLSTVVALLTWVTGSITYSCHCAVTFSHPSLATTISFLSIPLSLLFLSRSLSIPPWPSLSPPLSPSHSFQISILLPTTSQHCDGVKWNTEFLGIHNLDWTKTY